MKPDCPNHLAGAASSQLIFIVVLIALLGLSAYLFADRSKKATELAQLRATAAELQNTQADKAELEQLRGQSGQMAQLQQDKQELIKLRGEVATLRPLQAQAQKMQTEMQQLRAHLDQLSRSATDTATLRTQNEKLQGVLAEQQRSSQSLACIANLKTMESAKVTWANDLKKAPIDIPTDADLFGPNRYLVQRPVCPANGVYNLGAVQEKVTCNVPGHAY